MKERYQQIQRCICTQCIIIMGINEIGTLINRPPHICVFTIQITILNGCIMAERIIYLAYKHLQQNYLKLHI